MEDFTGYMHRYLVNIRRNSSKVFFTFLPCCQVEYHDRHVHNSFEVYLNVETILSCSFASGHQAKMAQTCFTGRIVKVNEGRFYEDHFSVTELRKTSVKMLGCENLFIFLFRIHKLSLYYFRELTSPWMSSFLVLSCSEKAMYSYNLTYHHNGPRAKDKKIKHPIFVFQFWRLALSIHLVSLQFRMIDNIM